MKTPAGRECSCYYEDFARGRSLQECRLLGPRGGWRPALCSACPVPGIQLANDCPNMVLHGEVKAFPLGLRPRVRVTAFCRKVNRAVADPHIGCEECHPGLQAFRVNAKG